MPKIFNEIGCWLVYASICLEESRFCEKNQTGGARMPSIEGMGRSHFKLPETAPALLMVHSRFHFLINVSTRSLRESEY
jgi:hypothetical protein